MAMHKNICRPDKDTFEHVADLMHYFLSSLMSKWMKNTMSIYVADKISILEAMWQKEFYRIASQKLSSSSTINVEVTHGNIDQQAFKINGKIDFYIDGQRQWAIEFLIRGDKEKEGLSDAQEHANRFQNKYKSLPRKEYLLVDFRPSKIVYVDFLEYNNNNNIAKEQPKLVPKRKFLPNYWIVVYDTDKYEKLDIYKYDQYGNFDIKKNTASFRRNHAFLK